MNSRTSRRKRDGCEDSAVGSDKRSECTPTSLLLTLLSGIDGIVVERGAGARYIRPEVAQPVWHARCLRRQTLWSTPPATGSRTHPAVHDVTALGSRSRRSSTVY